MRLSGYVEAGLGGGKDNSLPGLVQFNDFERAWGIFTIGEAFEWRWPPSILEGEDEALMSDLSQIRNYVGRIERELKKQKPKE